MEVRIPHSLTPAEVSRRIAATADLHDLELAPGSDGLHGVVSKHAGFLGTVRADYAILPGALVVTVRERPAFLPEGTLRRTLEEELARLVSG